MSAFTKSDFTRVKTGGFSSSLFDRFPYQICDWSPGGILSAKRSKGHPKGGFDPLGSSDHQQIGGPPLSLR